MHSQSRGCRRASLAAAVVFAVVVAACAPTTSVPGDPSTASNAPSPTSRTKSRSDTSEPPGESSASRALAHLPVKGRAPKTGYSREQFGPAWVDVDRNGCDTRNDMLRRDLESQTRSGWCVVVSGALSDPYTRATIWFVRGGTSEVDIDHVVALSNAWQTGAFAWPYAKRVAFANDPLNLLAVSASANRQKLDGDAATWLPANKAIRCRYVARQIAVKAKYELWVTPPEAEAMRRILSGCGDQTLPGPGPQPTIASNTGGPPPSPPVPGRNESGKARYYRVCADARAAGVTPIVRGTRMYELNTHLDADGDGVACE